MAWTTLPEIWRKRGTEAGMSSSMASIRANRGTTMKITNMAGASQTIGMMELAGRAGDGYSIGIVAFAGGVIQPQLTKLTYTIDSFRPVAISSGPNSYSICVKAGSSANYEEFISKINAGEKIYWTAPNSGSPAHLAGLYFLNKLGITNCEFVSYNGAAEALAALLSGDVFFYVTDDSVVATREKENQVKGILTLSDKRSAVLPDLECSAEKGVDGMGVFDAFSWVLVPASTPDNIYNYIKERFDAALTSAKYQEFLNKNNFVEMRVYSEDEMKKMIKNASDAVATVIELLK